MSIDPLVRKFLIFVSSTREDLLTERKAVHEFLSKRPGLEPYLFEHDSPARLVEKRLRQVIEISSVFVLILGHRYGSTWKGGIRERSVVQWELETARAREKLLRRLVLFDDVGIIILRKVYSEGIVIEPRQENFRNEVVGLPGYWGGDFKESAELLEILERYLDQWLTERAAGFTYLTAPLFMVNLAFILVVAISWGILQLPSFSAVLPILLSAWLAANFFFMLRSRL